MIGHYHWHEQTGMKFRFAILKNGHPTGMYVGDATVITGKTATSTLTFIRHGEKYMRYNFYNLALKKAQIIIKTFKNLEGLGIKIEYYFKEAQDEHTIQE